MLTFITKKGIRKNEALNIFKSEAQYGGQSGWKSI